MRVRIGDAGSPNIMIVSTTEDTVDHRRLPLYSSVSSVVNHAFGGERDL
jgi:hypothetical protein